MAFPRAPIRRHVLALFLAALSWPFFATPARAQTAVDLELLLAVDVSASVDSSEYALQVHGLAAAFGDPVVREAVRRGGSKGIAVAVVQWAGGRDQAVAVDWTHLRDDAGLDDFASRIAAMPRMFVGGDTWLGRAVRFSAAAVLGNRFRAPRQVIDLSGDGGAETIGLTKQARDEAIAAGLVVNGLAIETDYPGLLEFFRSNLIGGPGAFALRAADYDDFAAAMRQKLIREIAERPIASLTP